MSQKSRDLEPVSAPPEPEPAPRRVGRLTPDAMAALAAGTPGNTTRAYQGAIDRYIDWCEDTGLGSLPATAEDLTEYATHLTKEGRAPATIETARWAIIKWHKFAGYPAPPTDGLVLVLNGYRARLGETNDPKALPKKAVAAAPSALALVLASIDRTTPVGQRDAAIILVGFGIGGRRSEITGLDIGRLSIRDEGMQVHVYRKKMQKTDDPVIKRRDLAAICPVFAAEEWIATLAAHGRTSGPLFIRIDRHGNLGAPIIRDDQEIGDPSGRMTGQAIGDVIRLRARAAGLSGKWSGHSLRRGLATEMYKAGAERRLIERQGGWSAGSTAVSGYIEDAERWEYDALKGVL